MVTDAQSRTFHTCVFFSAFEGDSSPKYELPKLATHDAQTDSGQAAWLETRTMDATCRPRTLRPATTARDTHARKRTTSIKEKLAKRIASIKEKLAKRIVSIKQNSAKRIVSIKTKFGEANRQY